MLRTKAIRKIFVTTVSLFIIICVYSIPSISNKNVLRTNLEIEEITSLGTNNIYLLNKDGYLVKNKIILDSDKIQENVSKILNNLIINDNTKFSSGLRGVIPENTIVREIIYAGGIVTVNFSKDILNVEVNHEKIMIQAIVYSIMDLDGVKGVSILVEGENLDKYPNTNEKLNLILDKQIGINTKYDLTSRNDVSKVVIYYLTDIDNCKYYVPVTKYVNDSREKIKIIVEELSTNFIYEDNLMSLLNNKTKLIDSIEKDNLLILNFNNYLYDHDDKILEEVLYSISYSVFDNYNVDMVMFQVNGKPVTEISNKQLP